MQGKLEGIQGGLEKENPLHTVKAHEFIGYYILSSKYFEKKIRRINQIYHADRVQLNLHRIRQFCLGISLTNQNQFLADIVSGTIDADRLDYLQRDAHNIGFPRLVDAERVYETLDVGERPGEDPLWRILGIKNKGISAVLTLLRARERLNDVVYKHHITTLTEQLVLRALETQKEISGRELIGATDPEMHNLLKDNPYFQRYLYRKLPKRYFYINIEAKVDSKQLMEMESLHGKSEQKTRELAAELGLTREDGKSVFFDFLIEALSREQSEMVEIWVFPTGEMPTIGTKRLSALLQRTDMAPSQKVTLRIYLDFRLLRQKIKGNNDIQNIDKLKQEVKKAVCQVFKLDSDKIEVERIPKLYQENPIDDHKGASS